MTTKTKILRAVQFWSFDLFELAMFFILSGSIIWACAGLAHAH